MPHCIVEHSITLDPQKLLAAVCKGAVESALFETSDIKTRAIAYEHYQTNASQRDFGRYHYIKSNGNTAICFDWND